MHIDLNLPPGSGDELYDLDAELDQVERENYDFIALDDRENVIRDLSSWSPKGLPLGITNRQRVPTIESKRNRAAFPS